ncbi:MAG: glycosyltransferase family 2 protein [Gemmatimonadota bacterium]|nr:glycosyltransferase family 2 protein [Gemmatimonadota bacterium]
MEPKRKADIAVIVTCHNYGRYLRQCLRSIETQVLKPAFVLVVDDASTDETGEVARQFPEMEYRRVEFQNGNRSRNYGFNHVSAEWVVFFDADNYMSPEFLDVLHGAARSRPGIDFVYCDRINFTHGDGSWHHEPDGVRKSGPFQPERLRKGNYVDVASLLRSDRFPGFDESIRRYQDWDLWLNIVLRQHGRGHYVPKPLYFYRIHDANISRRESDDRAVWRVRRKYRLGVYFNLPLVRDARWLFCVLRRLKRTVFGRGR